MQISCKNQLNFSLISRVPPVMQGGDVGIGRLRILVGCLRYVNRDVSSHSVVFGNLCVIKDNVTSGYINCKV